MKHNYLFTFSICCALFLSFSFNLNAQIPGQSEFDGSGNDYIEYIHGNLPIIISAPHGGTITSGSLPNRSCGTNEPDDNTAILIRAIQDEIFAQTGGYAHVIINNLNRRKLDPNREVSEATCSSNTDANDTTEALYYWNAWHSFIDDASTSVEANYGKGLYIDLHGQSHTVPRIEIGYRISRADLINTTPNHLNTVSGSTITSLVGNNINNHTQEELVRGSNSLGALFHNAPGTYYAGQNYPGCGRNGTNGYRATPSNFNGGSGNCNDTAPNNSNYFSGFYYNNERHGSGPTASDGQGGGGTIDGIMTEVNRRVRDVGTTLEPFAIDYANVVLNYINIHYNDFAVFNYDAAMYDITDSDPTPTLTGVTGGQFSSTGGLSIDPNTGVIDTSNSITGVYIVTYDVGPNQYFSTTQNVEIVDGTLSLNDIEKENQIVIYPNPTQDVLHYKASKNVYKIVVFNALGQVVDTQIFNQKSGIINMTKYSTGLYLTKFYDNTGKRVLTKQILKR